MAEQTCHLCGNPVATSYCTSCGAAMKPVPVETVAAGVAESSNGRASRALVVGLIVAVLVLVGGGALALSRGNSNDAVVVETASKAEDASTVTTTMVPTTTIEVTSTTSVAPPPPTTAGRAPSTTAAPSESEHSNTGPVINWLETCPSFRQQAIAWLTSKAIPDVDLASLVLANNYSMLGASWTIHHTDGRPNQFARYMAMCNSNGTVEPGFGMVN